jgi:hypothetical protein
VADPITNERLQGELPPALNSDRIHQIAATSPRLRSDHANVDEYLAWWTSYARAIEAFLGEGYEVIGFNPDFQVRATIQYPGHGDEILTRTYSFTVSIELAIAIRYKEPKP